MSGVTLGIRGWYWSTLDSTLAYEADCGSLWCQFGITLERVGVVLTSLWGHFAHFGGRFGITLGWFLDYLGITLLMFSIWRSVFKNTCSALFFHDLNGSGVNSEPLWGHVGWLWVTLGSFLAYEAEFGSLWNHLGPLWIHFGKFLAAISTYEGGFK